MVRLFWPYQIMVNLKKILIKQIFLDDNNGDNKEKNDGKKETGLANDGKTGGGNDNNNDGTAPTNVNKPRYYMRQYCRYAAAVRYCFDLS